MTRLAIPRGHAGLPARALQGAGILLRLGILILFASMQPVFITPINAQQVIRVQPEDQTASTGEDEAETEERPQLRTLPPAYDAQMLDLAEALGSLHYLRQLCGANEGQLWRDEMEKMLEAETPSTERRAQLIASFNRGFRSYREIYRECTLPAAEAANRFLTRGMRLAAEIPGRYGR